MKSGSPGNTESFKTKRGASIFDDSINEKETKYTVRSCRIRNSIHVRGVTAPAPHAVQPHF